jgi:autotransporter-associated beta strand protein
LLIFDQNVDSTFSPTISGSGMLIKSGGGTVTFSNENINYSGDTILLDGNLAYTNAMDAFSSKFFIFTPTSLIFDQSSNSSLSSAITGTGLLTKLGSGTLSLTNNEINYTGDTTISAGALKFINDTNLFSSTITNDASLIFEQNINSFFYPQIIGAGSLIKNGSGILTLPSLSNLFTGNIIISEGAIKFINTTSTLSNNITINKNGSLIFDQNSDSSFNGAITGEGSLIKYGNRTLTLSDTSNNYSGNTTILGGYLKFINDTSAFQSKININSQGILYFSQSLDSSFAAQITGNGQLAKDGAGILTLLNTSNDYSGSTTIFSGGLKFTQDTSYFSSDVNNDASLIFDQTFDTSFNPKISGSGTLTKNGLAILTLTNSENSYVGATTINNGGIKFTNDVTNFQSDITNNSTLEFLSNGDNSSFSNIISGTGTLIKNGLNTISFNNTITQDQITINSGTFALIKAAINVSTLISVNQRGSFKGAGTILADIDVYGTFRVGNSIGTINQTGDYTQKSFSTFQTEITQTQASLLNITGNLTIENPTNFEVLLNPGEKYRNFETYTVITYTGTKTGEFTNVFSNSVSLIPILDYSTANQIKMDLLFQNYLESIKSGNPAKVAEYIDELTILANTDLELIDAHLLSLNQKDLFNALNILHPAKYKSLILSQENIFIRLTDKLNSYLNSHVINQCSKIEHRKKTNFFNTFFYNFYDQKGEKELFGFKTNSYSDLFGFDFQILKNLYFGPVFAFSYGDTFFANNSFVGKTYSYYAGIYGSYFSKNSYINLSKIYSYNQYKVNRKILFSNINRVANSNHSSISSILNLDMGLLRNIKSISINPFLNLNYLYLDENDFKEKGADSINLQVTDEEYDMFRSEIGFNFSTCNTCRKIIPIIKFAYVRESRLNGNTYTAKFIDENNEFEVRGIKPTKNRALSSITIKNSLLKDKLIITSKYLNEFGVKFKVHDFSFTLNYNF